MSRVQTGKSRAVVPEPTPATGRLGSRGGRVLRACKPKGAAIFKLFHLMTLIN